ncbi:MAG: hypothetical protein Kow00106_07220 [Anaerolineae bacterium]
MPQGDPDDEQRPPGLYERTIAWLAGLPWWALILGVVAVSVLYSMLTSEAYRRVIQALTDNPQVSTEDLFEVVQIVGEPTMVTGTYVGETQDSVTTVVDNLLDKVIDTREVTYTGFILAEDPASLTIRTDSGLFTISKDRIVEEHREPTDEGERITLTYVDRVTVSGVLTKRTDKKLTIRTVNEESETFDKARILSRQVIPCEQVGTTNCVEGEYVTIERQGETITGTLNTLSNTNISLILEDGSQREMRRSDVDLFNVPTLTVAVHANSANVPVKPGDEVRIALSRAPTSCGRSTSWKRWMTCPFPCAMRRGRLVWCWSDIPRWTKPCLLRGRVRSTVCSISTTAPTACTLRRGSKSTPTPASCCLRRLASVRRAAKSR